MRVAWLTDLHLNFLADAERDAFLAGLGGIADVALLSGDLAEAPELGESLLALRRALGCPLYFVLGNHDCYVSSVRETRERVRALCGRAPGLTWLGGAGVIALTDRVGLAGHDGWADTRAGDWEGTRVQLTDDFVIEELVGSRDARRAAMQRLADESAAHARAVLPEALARFERVFFLTHVPPFAEACLHRGGASGAAWLPYFANTVLGAALRELAAAHRGRHLTVLCGHTHDAACIRPDAGLEVRVGGARYGSPAVQDVFELE